MTLVGADVTYSQSSPRDNLSPDTSLVTSFDEKIETSPVSIQCQLNATICSPYENKVNITVVDTSPYLQQKAQQQALLTVKPIVKQKTPVKVSNATILAPQPYSPTISHEDLMAQAGISPDQYQYADYIVEHESGWNPTAYNSIGACSLVQALPCSKIGNDWRDPVTALRWGNQYVLARYGSWYQAYLFKLSHGWY